MSTPSTTTTVTTTITATPALIANVSELCNAQSTLEGKWLSTADACKESASKLGYTKEQVRPMIVAAYTAVAEKAAKANKLDADATKAYVADFISRKGPDISKIVTLAYPATEAAAKALADARAHNAEGAKGTVKIGVNELLNIARDKEGTTTVETVLQKRQEKAAAKGAQNGGAPRVPSAPVTTPSRYDEAEARKMLTNAITYVRGLGKKSEDELDSLIAECVTAYNEAVAASK